MHLNLPSTDAAMHGTVLWQYIFATECGNLPHSATIMTADVTGPHAL